MTLKLQTVSKIAWNQRWFSLRMKEVTQWFTINNCTWTISQKRSKKTWEYLRLRRLTTKTQCSLSWLTKKTSTRFLYHFRLMKSTWEVLSMQATNASKHLTSSPRSTHWVDQEIKKANLPGSLLASHKRLTSKTNLLKIVRFMDLPRPPPSCITHLTRMIC